MKNNIRHQHFQLHRSKRNPVFSMQHVIFIKNTPMQKCRRLITLFILVLTGFSLSAQKNTSDKNAADLTDVATINKILGSHLQYNAGSPANKLRRYECRYTDPVVAERYIAINLLESKLQNGHDVLKPEFEHARAEVAAGRKILDKYTSFYPFTTGGAYAYYLTSPADRATGTVLFKFRKGDYIVAMTAEGMDVATVTAKINALYAALKAKL